MYRFEACAMACELGVTRRDAEAIPALFTRIAEEFEPSPRDKLRTGILFHHSSELGDPECLTTITITGKQRSLNFQMAALPKSGPSADNPYEEGLGYATRLLSMANEVPFSSTRTVIVANCSKSNGTPSAAGDRLFALNVRPLGERYMTGLMFKWDGFREWPYPIVAQILPVNQEAESVHCLFIYLYREQAQNNRVLPVVCASVARHCLENTLALVQDVFER